MSYEKKQILLTDDLFHARTNSPYWNESAWFSLMIPERGINGFIYFYHRPNMLKSSGGVSLWDTSGDEIHNCLFWEFDEHLHLPPGANMYNFELDSTLSCKTVELQKSYRLTFERDGYEVDLAWNGVYAPNSSKDPDKLPLDAGVAGWVRHKAQARGYRPDPVGAGGYPVGHYEQIGRMTGTVTVDGERIEVDCWSIRDHTWGPRYLSPELPRNRLDWGMASPDSAFGVYSFAELPWREDPVVGVTDRVIDGWYIKDGVVAEIMGGTCRVVERDDTNRQVRVVIDAEDHLGRRLHTEGVRENALNWFGYGFCYCTWSLSRWEWDGHADFGEQFEWCTQRQYRQMSQAAKRGAALVGSAG